jgi:hypothetical protein
MHAHDRPMLSAAMSVMTQIVKYQIANAASVALAAISSALWTANGHAALDLDVSLVRVRNEARHCACRCIYPADLSWCRFRQVVFTEFRMLCAIQPRTTHTDSM